jgi:type I restriction enzyme, S subunit
VSIHELPAWIKWPAGWRNVPLWAMYERTKDVGHPDEEMLSVYREYGVIRKSSRDDNTNQTAENRNIYQLIDQGWLVVNRMKAWQGSVGISPLRGIVSGHYICFRPRHDENPRFLNWLLRSNVYTLEYKRMSRGVRPGQVEIDNDELRSLRIALPPLEEQRRIADFLDATTDFIDRLMGSQLRVLLLLEERVDAQILAILGRSLLVNQRGTPITPMRRVIQKLNRPVMPTSAIITAFRDGQVTSRAIRRNEGYTLAANAEPQGQGVEAGDIVIHGLDGFAGAIGDSEASGNCSPVYHVCIPIDGGSSAFCGRLLRLLALSDYLALFGASARERAVDFRNWQIFGHAPIPRVDPAVQHEIGNSITKIRPLREEINRFNERLAERRQALITAAVTGQIDVTTARGTTI